MPKATEPTSTAPAASAAPLHPTWPGWEHDLAVVRQGKALIKAFGVARGADADQAWQDLQAILPALRAAEDRMDAGLNGASRRRRKRAGGAA